jgi:beta-lactamase regulating signal transducer with metallopeptidase domain
MNSLFIQLISAQAILLIGYFAYHWWYQKDNNFVFNRYFLLSLFCVALLLPSLPVTIKLPSLKNITQVGGAEDNTRQAQVMAEDQTFIAPVGQATEAPAQSAQKASILNSWEAWFLSELLVRFYGLVCLFFTFRFFIQLFSLWKLVRNCPREWQGDHYLIRINKKIQPFSFFNTIVINPDLYSPQQYEMIYRHEMIHVRQMHNLDIILSELFSILFWINPIAWRLRDTIRQNLEFIVDSTLLNLGTNRKIYQYSLLAINVGNNPQLVMANYFNQSLLKKRIIMMNKKKSPDSFSFHHLLLLPLLVAMVLISPLTAQQTTEDTKNSIGQVEFNTDNALEGAPVLQGEKLFGIVKADLSMEDLQDMQEEFKKRGIELNYSHINFTEDGQLSSIKLDMIHWNKKTSSVELNNKGQAIEDEIITYFFHDHEGKKAEMGIGKQFPRGSFGKDEEDRILKSVTGVIVFEEKEGNRNFWIKGKVDLSKTKKAGKSTDK